MSSNGEKPAKTEGDKLTTNTAGILQFGKDANNILEALRVSKITNDQIMDHLGEIITQLKIANKHLEHISNLEITTDDL